MNLKDYFTQALDRPAPDLQQREASWDLRAPEVSQFQVPADDPALSIIQRQQSLNKARVLEISFGGGRHLIEFMRLGAQVSGVEISQQLLASTQQKITSLGLSAKLERLVHSSWEELDLSALGWEEAFDLVFLYMSPALSNSSMLQKALAATRRGFYLADYSYREDSLLFSLQDEFNLPRRSVGADSADDLYNLHNLLYQWGYCPNLTFINNIKERKFEPAYVLERYASWLWRGEATQANKQQLLAALEARAKNGKVATKSRDLNGHLYLDKQVKRW